VKDGKCSDQATCRGLFEVCCPVRPRELKKEKKRKRYDDKK
jgi:hypothetical protein